MPKYYVQIDQHLTHSEREDVEFGSWSESWHNTFRKVSTTELSDRWAEYRTIDSDLEIKRGEDIYLVWVEWSSGDSFGHGYYTDVAPIAIFREREDALALEKMIGEHMSFLSFEFVSRDGQTITIYPSWRGYFDNLEEIHIEQEFMR